MGSENITDDTKTVIVGQQIPLSVEVVGTEDPVSNIQWNVPGTKVTNFTANNSTGTAPPLNNMNTSQLTFYWTDGGDNREVTLGCRIGTTPFSKSTHFNVKRPSATITATRTVTTVQVHTVRFGGLPPNGITFHPTINIPQGFSGSTQWVQLVDPVFRRKLQSGVWQRWAGAGLDSQYPYSFLPGDTNDSPAFVFADNEGIIIEKTANLSFQMFFMFKPDLANAIWVPLRKIEWAWFADATYDPATDVVTLISPPNSSSNGPDQDCVDHPTWTRNAASNTWVNE